MPAEHKLRWPLGAPPCQIAWRGSDGRRHHYRRSLCDGDTEKQEGEETEIQRVQSLHFPKANGFPKTAWMDFQYSKRDNGLLQENKDISFRKTMTNCQGPFDLVYSLYHQSVSLETTARLPADVDKHVQLARLMLSNGSFYVQHQLASSSCSLWITLAA